MQIKTVLIANRGEIAVRIARVARDLGIKSIAIYSEADAGALHTQVADEAYALPGNTAADTYMNVPALLDIAVRAEHHLVQVEIDVHQCVLPPLRSGTRTATTGCTTKKGIEDITKSETTTGTRPGIVLPTALRVTERVVGRGYILELLGSFW